MAGEVGRLVVRILGDSTQFTAAMSGVQKKLATAQAKMASAGSAMTKGLTVPLVAVGAAAVVSAVKIEDAMNTVRTKTGATGKAFEALGKDFRAVMKQVPESAALIGEVMGELQTRTGLVGEPLQKLTKQVLELGRVAGEDTASLVAATTRVFGDWSVATEKQSSTLDWLWKVSQQTGITIGDLSEKVVKFGGPMRQLGFSLEETTAILGKFEKEGVNVDLVMGSMRIALGRMARAGEAPVETLKRVTDQIKNAGSAGEANALALELFGARAGPDMAAAIREGRFEIDDLMTSLKGSKETIGDAAKDTQTLGDKLKMLKNNAMLAVEPIGIKLVDAFEKIMPSLMKVAEFIGKVFTAFGKLPSGVQTAAIAFGVFLVAAGPLLTLGSKLIGAVRGVMTFISGIGSSTAAAATTVGSSTAAASTGVATLTSKVGAFGAAALPIAGILGGLAYTIYDAVTASGKLREEWRKKIEQAVPLATAYDDLDTKARSLAQGTAEYAGAMGELAVAAKAVVDATHPLFGTYDQFGNVVGAETDMVWLLDDVLSKASDTTKALAATNDGSAESWAMVLENTSKSSEGMSEWSGTLNKATEAAKKLIREGKIDEALRTLSDPMITRIIKKEMGERSADFTLNMKAMETSIKAFNERMAGPDGIATLTGIEVGNMLTMISDANPQIKALGLEGWGNMVKAINEKHPEIAERTSAVMGTIATKISELPAHERTTEKMNEIIQAELAKDPEVAAAAGVLMTGISTTISTSDFQTPMTTALDGINRAIANSDAISHMGGLLGNLQDMLNLNPLQIKVKYTAPSGAPYLGPAFGDPELFDSGGYAPRGGIVHPGEYVINADSTRKLGLGILSQLNSGTIPSNSTSVGDVHFHSVSPDYDIKRFRRLLDDVARDSYRQAQMMPRTV